MSKIPLSYRQHRQTIGNHTNWQDRKQKSQKYQDNYIQHLAQIPGRHTENIRRQEIAYAALQLVAILSSIRNCGLNPVVSPQCTNERKTTNCLLAAETCWSPAAAEPIPQNTINRCNYLPEEMQQKTVLKRALKPEVEPMHLDTPGPVLSLDLICNGLKTMLHSVRNVFHKTNQLVLQYDPLRFPMAAASSLFQETDIQNINHVIIRDRDGEIFNSTHSSCNVKYQTTDCDFIENFRYALIQYYQDYYANYPNLKQRIASHLKAKIIDHFNMDIDPDEVQGVPIFDQLVPDKKKFHFSAQFANKTLAEWFFIHFNSNLKKDAQNIQMQLYVGETKLLNFSMLLKSLDEMDFYNDIKEKLSKSFQDKKIHIKKYFIDFICDLDISGINNESVKDVLNGVGMILGRTVYTSLFNINGYVASTAFCFRNEAGRLTFYFPESTFKFISFQDKAEMRAWFLRAWSEESQRNMIASHFENQHNRALYSEVVEWLNIIHQDTGIATELVYIPYDHFFVYLFNQMKDKTMFDFDETIKLEPTFRKNVWEKMMNIASITPDFTSHFSSLNPPLRRMTEALTYRQKNKEWCTLKRSAMDTAALLMLDKIRKFPDKVGYDFIDTVVKSIQTIEMKTVTSTLEQDTVKKQNFIQFGQEYLVSFYEDYGSKYPGLRRLACSFLKEKIQERFHLNIDPDKVRFMHFDNVEYTGDRMHYAPALENRTLTECLFTNFGAEIRDRMSDMDAKCGIYDISVWSKKELHASDELNIKPTDFIKLIDELDFFRYAEKKLTESFKDKDAHIKKYFIDFVNHLSISDINEEAAKDVLAGVGIGKGRKVQVSLFDVNGYFASNAFIFRSENNDRVILYFPGSDFKFKVFISDDDARAWIGWISTMPKYRAMIVSHFTIANRKEGLIFTGVAKWLEFISEHYDYFYKIANKIKEVKSEYFFESLFEQLKEKTFSDLDDLVESDAEILRNMWEEMIDASNIIPNPISPFLSLAFHLEHAIDADTDEEKMQEWNKIKYDAVNFIVMVVLSKAVDFPDKQGYEFIDLVNRDVETGNINQVIGIAEMNPNAISNPDSPSWDWLFSQATYDENQVTYDITSFTSPLKTFLPLREVDVNNGIGTTESEIRAHIESYYQQYRFDVFYGFHNPYDEVPLYIQQARIKIKMHLNRVREHLKNVSSKLSDENYRLSIKNFLSQLVNSRDESVLDQTYFRLQVIVMRAVEFLNRSEKINDVNIAIISTKQVSNLKLPFLFESAITDTDFLEELPFGFVHTRDPLRRIHILLDRMLNSEEVHNIFTDKDSIVYNTLAHELSHISSNTLDIFPFDMEEKATPQENVKSALESFNIAMDGGVASYPQFVRFMEIIRQYYGGHRGITEADLINKIKTDPMLKANVIMENADTFVLCVKEIARMSLERRVKKEDKDIFDNLVSSYLALVFVAAKNHYVNTQIGCK